MPCSALCTCIVLHVTRSVCPSPTYTLPCTVHSAYALFYCSPSLLPIPIPFACFREADAKYWLYSSTPLAQEVYNPPTHAPFSWLLSLCTVCYAPCIMHHIDVLPCLDLNWTCIYAQCNVSGMKSSSQNATPRFTLQWTLNGPSCMLYNGPE